MNLRAIDHEFLVNWSAGILRQTQRLAAEPRAFPARVSRGRDLRLDESEAE